MNQPQIGGDGTYIDPEGRLWTTYSSEGARLGIDPTTISNNMAPDAAVIDGLNTVGSPAPLHLRSEMQQAVAHLMAIPERRIVTDIGIYTVANGRTYASAPVAAKYFGIDAATIRKIAKRSEIATLDGRDEQGVVTLFSLDDLAQHPTIKARLDGQIRVDENGYFESPDGTLWATVHAFFNSLPAEVQANTDKSSVWMQAKKHCRSQKAIDRGGRPNAEIFPIEELKTKALALINESFRADKKTGYYSEKDEQGNEIMRWATKNAWQDLLKVSKFALNKGLAKTYGNWDSVPRRKGLSQNKKPDWLYSEKVMKEILAYIFEAEIQSENGIHIQKIADEIREAISKKVYKSTVALKREVHLTAENIKKRLLKAGCPTIDGVDRHSGADEELFDYETFLQVFAEQLRVILNTTDDGDLIERDYGRCVTIQRFCEETGTPRKKLDRLLKEEPQTHLRRRDPRTQRLETLYPEKALLALSKELTVVAA